MPQRCLHDSLDLQRHILERWDQNTNRVPPAQPIFQAPMASSTPFADMVAPGLALAAETTSHLQSSSVELGNTTRVLAAALHQAKLEPPIFSNDGVVHPEDWLQAVVTYRSSLDLTDTQILRELPRFLAKEPKKWFSVFHAHVVA